MRFLHTNDGILLNVISAYRTEIAPTDSATREFPAEPNEAERV